MKIPLLNIYIMREATFEKVVKNAALKALGHQKKQMGLLLADNYKLTEGKLSKRTLRFRRSKK